jgi:phospholipid/cholesterol/gamma-HCH transport system ATP-binding protein
MLDSLNENELIRAVNLGFSFRTNGQKSSKPLFQDLSLSLTRSKVLYLVGPSGMGKTTLLKVFAGILQPVGGELYVQGAPVTQISSSKRRLLFQRVAMTFQRSGLFDSMTAMENLLFPLKEVVGLDENAGKKTAQIALEQVGLLGNENKYPNEMSGGMQKRLGIARALVLQPEIILFDDPTAGLDPITSGQIVELIMTVHSKSNNGTLIATSDWDLVVQMAPKHPSQVGFLYEGKIIEVGTLSEILNSKHPVICQFTQGLSTGPLNRKEFL